MANAILIDELLTYLVSQNIVRANPSTAGALPPCWRNPKDGPPTPTGDPAAGTGDQATVTIRKSGQIPPRHLEGFLEDQVVEVIVRGFKSTVVERLQRQIRLALNDRHHFTIGTLTVQWCLLARGEQALPGPPDAAKPTVTTTQSFTFQVRVADLLAA